MMSERQDRRLLKVSIAFITGLVAIGIIVANLRYLDLGDGSQGIGPQMGQVTIVLVLALAAVVVATIVLFLLQYGLGSRPRGARLQLNSNSLIGLIVLCLIIVALAAINGQSPNSDIDPPVIDPGIDPDPIDTNPVTGDPTGGVAAAYIVVAVLAIVLVFVVSRHTRAAPLHIGKAGPAPMERDAANALNQATMALLAGEEPRSVIVRTYQQMSRLLGKGRSLKYLTPREVAEIARLDLGWPEGPLIELTSLFEEAWYSHHVMGESERDRALRAFEAIVSKENQRRAEIGCAAS